MTKNIRDTVDVEDVDVHHPIPNSVTVEVKSSDLNLDNVKRFFDGGIIKHEIEQPPVPSGIIHDWFVKTGPVVNPKELAGAKKPAVWSVMPRWIMLLVGRVMQVGAAKYGAFNYRESAIAASTYQDAIERHLQLWFDGEDDDMETNEEGKMVGSGVSHLASVIASCVLLLDAQQTGKLVDDRQKTGIVRRTLDELNQKLKDYPIK